jgi:hypothetical protein
MFRTQPLHVKPYTVSLMSMRASRLARLAYARTASRTPLITSLGVPRSRILDKVQIRPNGSPGIRPLATLATEAVNIRSVQSNVPNSTPLGTAASNALRLQVEAVDGLLRSGIGGSDVWTGRLQGVKDDLKVQRPRRIAGTSLNVVFADQQSSETQSLGQETLYPRCYRTQYQIRQQAGKRY